MVYTVSYELARVFIMSMITASVKDESKKPLSVLFSVPTESYSIEVSQPIYFPILLTKIHRDYSPCFCIVYSCYRPNCFSFSNITPF